jgi:hypothetical protein
LTTFISLSAAQTPTSSASANKSSSNGGQIAGAIVGVILGLAAVVALVAFCLHRKRNSDRRRKSEFADLGVGVSGYEKQVDHYSRAPLPPLPSIPDGSHRSSGGAASGEIGSGGTMSQTTLDSRVSQRFNAATTVARKKLGMTKPQPRAHVLEWPQEFAAGGLAGDVHEGV